MKKFYFAIINEKHEKHVLTVKEHENIVAKIKELKIIVCHPCKSYSEAVSIVEAWKKYQ